MNKKINQLSTRTAVGTDLALVGDPSTGTSYKTTFAELPLVPYTGATGAVSLGLYGLTAGTLTLQEQTLNSSTYKLTQRMASNDYWSIYGFSTVADYGDLYFELQDNAAFADGQRFRFHYGNASSGTPKDILLMDYNTATFDGAVQVNDLAGTGTRMVVTDTNGALSTQAIPSLSSGGSSISYYLNGGTAASVGTYYQMSQTAVIGTNADFTKTGNGLISQFLTDVGDPNRLQIPAGNWNFEMFFSMSSVGGNTAFYVELLKYDGTTFTSIASSTLIPEEITGGTNIDLYLTSLAVPATTLLVTDRLALRVYIVNNSGGRTVTLHTQDSHLCQIITNFAGGVSALNGLTANTQYFATGTSGTDFGISSASDTHTFNLPTASATNRGALSSADWTTFNGKANNNIYTADGTLSGNRTVSLSTFDLFFSGVTGTINTKTLGGNVNTDYAGMNMFNSANELVGSFQIGGVNAGTASLSGHFFFGARKTGGNVYVIDTTATPVHGFYSAGNVGINTGLSMLASAQLQVNSTTRGFLAPRMTTTQKNNISSPATGLQVYDTTLGSLNVYNGTSWIALGAGGGGGSMAIGGSITSATAGSVLFAGTSGVLQQDNANLFWDDTNNRLGIGTNAPSAGIEYKSSGTDAWIRMSRGANNYHAGFTLNPAGAWSTTNLLWNVGLAASTNNYQVWGWTGNAEIYYQRIFGNTGNTWIGATSTSPTDAGYRLDVNGTARVSGKLTITAGTTAASQINLASSTAPTSPNDGDIWFDGTDLKMRIGGVTKTFTLV